MANLAKLLQADMSLPDMAKRLAAAGRGKDTILAHINPREAKLLKSRGGSGEINPATGIMEFAYGEDDNAGEAEAYQYQQENPVFQDQPSKQSLANTDASAEYDPQNAPATSQTFLDMGGYRNKYGNFDQNYSYPTAQNPFPSPRGFVGTYNAPLPNLNVASSPSVFVPTITDQINQSAAQTPAPLTPAARESAAGLPGYGVNASAQNDVPAANVPNVGAGAYQPPASAQALAPPKAGGFMQGVSDFTNNLSELTKALSPLTPYLKGGVALAAGSQGNKAAAQMQQAAAKNEAEIRSLATPYKDAAAQIKEKAPINEAAIKALADPYRKQAGQYQQQGQALIDMGQAGGLTAAQQKQLEIQRAVAAQQMASSGVTGGTAQQQLEANIQQQASTFAQQNVDQGMKLVAAAQGINQTADKYISDAINLGYSQNKDANTVNQLADKYITDAIAAGYAQNKDAQQMAQDFYRSIAGFLLPETRTEEG